MPAGRPARKDVPSDLTWNLTHIYASPADWEADFASIDGLLAAVTAFSGRLGKAKALLELLCARDALIERLVKVEAYSRLSLSVDGNDGDFQARSARTGALQARVGAALSFIRSELTQLPEGAIEEMLRAQPALETYRLQLEEVVRARPHALHPETEQTLAALSESLDVPATIWQRTTTSDLVCEPIGGVDGAETPVSIAGYVFGLRHSADRETRRRAYESLGAGLARHKATVATTLATHIRRNVTMARLRRYGSAAEMILEPQRIPLPVYRGVLDTIHTGMARHVRRLMTLKQRLLAVDKLHMYDLEAPLDPGYEPSTTFTESERIIRDGLAPLGDEYDRLIAHAFSDRWVDRADNVGKRSGAFCATVYGVHPYVLTTWSDNLRSAMILAHELGHAGHGVLSCESQVVSNTRVSLFFVEAPSTVNELLLGRHILRTADDERLRRFVILQFLGTFTHNFVTHMLEAHFEQRLYDLAEADKPITLPAILDVQGEVYERFYGDTVAIDDVARLYWSQQPHFYVNLYPYTYAAGLSCGVGVVDAIEREGQPAVDRWLTTLRAGGTLPPLELAKMAGVDMTARAPMERAVAYFGELVDELERSFS